MEKEKAGGFEFAQVIGVVFITLKLVGVITWSWWWVVSPFWISWGLVILIHLIFILIAVILAKHEKRHE